MSNLKKGKKINYEFVNKFISTSISNGHTSSQQIIEEAKKKIESIDKKIMEIQLLKERRSDLLDVVLSFDHVKPDRQSEKDDLALMNLKANEIILFIMEYFQNNDILDYSLLKAKFYVKEVNETLATLASTKVISKNNKDILKGRLFEKYKNVLNSN